MGYKNVCFDCRKAFNKGADYENFRKTKCPKCGIIMKEVSHLFRPPKQNDIKKWEVAKYLMENGFLYQHVFEKIYKSGKAIVFEDYATYPENMRDVKEFVEKYKNRTIAEK